MTPKKYNELNELLAEHSRLSAELSAVESQVNVASLEAARPMLPGYAETKAKIGDIEAVLLRMAQEHPELFPDDKKSHQTPFGALSFRRVSFLEIDDEEKAVLKIKEACHKEYLKASRDNRTPAFTAEQLIRTHEAPNVEALECLSDELLKSLFGIERKREEKFSVKPLEVKADKLAKAQRKDAETQRKAA